jgi:glycosyltransferase involved in cell wall biosynthesis
LEPCIFSVVIPTHNRRAMLERCLGSLSRQTMAPSEFEVIVVDDGSTDDTETWLASGELPLPVLAVRTDNGGPARARNVGAARARGAYLAFTEDDVLVAPDWLERARRSLDEGGGDVLEGLTIEQRTRRALRRLEREHAWSFIPCNLFVRRRVFEELGGYDPEFFDAKTKLYFREDADLGFRILDGGYRADVAPDAIVEHPPMVLGAAASLRQARRHVFDPLLYRKHPRRFRRLIEVKTVWGVRVHRPQHYVALVTALGWVAALAGASARSGIVVGVGAAVGFGGSAAIRLKYQGLRGSLRLYRLRETAGFLALPLVYLGAVVRGCVRYRSLGALL